MLCYYRHEVCGPDPGEEHQKTDTSDMVDMLGEKAHKYLREAKDYNFIAPGAVEVDTPDTPMTNVPEEGAEPAGDEASDAEPIAR